MSLFRTPLIDSASPLIFLDGPYKGCATPYLQTTLLSISKNADQGSSASADYSSVLAQIGVINGQISALNVAMGGKVNKAAFLAYGATSGTVSRTAFATYTAPTASAAYVQSEMQAVMNHLQELSRQVGAIRSDLKL